MQIWCKLTWDYILEQTSEYFRNGLSSWHSVWHEIEMLLGRFPLVAIIEIFVLVCIGMYWYVFLYTYKYIRLHSSTFNTYNTYRYMPYIPYIPIRTIQTIQAIHVYTIKYISLHTNSYNTYRTYQYIPYIPIHTYFNKVVNISEMVCPVGTAFDMKLKCRWVNSHW